MSALSDAISKLRSNERQWEAFQTDDHCAVLAPPGSGKTMLLTTKLAHAMVESVIVPPRGAACITMTNEAALELRRRLRALGVGPRPNLFIGTVHAFALSRIVGPFAAAAGRANLAASRLASDLEVDESFDVAFAAGSFRSDERRDVRSTTARARQRLDLSGDVMLGGPRIAELGRRLQDDLVRRRLYDFTDLVRHAVELVEGHDWLRRVLAATYARVYVDEYQDLAPGLDRIVRAMTLTSGLDSTLFAVGDPDQAIYAFSGAHPQLLRRLAAEEQMTAVVLERNYRSGQGIIDVALRALGENRTVTSESPGGSVSVHPVRGGEQAQATEVVRLVQEALSQGVALEQVAVLASWSSDRDLCAQSLRQVGVPVFARSDRHWASTPVTMLLERMAAWSVRRDDAGLGLSEIVDDLSALGRDANDHEMKRGVVRVLLDGRDSGSAAEFVEALVQIALLPLVEGDFASADSRELRRMRGALDVRGAAHAMTIAGLGARARAPGHVLASTIHAAKGLEFDHVVIAGADEAALPGFSPSAEEVAEARRKFYVSITRARNTVQIVHTDSRVSKAGNRYAVRPSRFIDELGL